MPRLTQDQRKVLAKVLQMRAAAGKGLTPDESKEARRLSRNLLKLNAMEERKKATKAKAHQSKRSAFPRQSALPRTSSNSPTAQPDGAGARQQEFAFHGTVKQGMKYSQRLAPSVATLREGLHGKAG